MFKTKALVVWVDPAIEDWLYSQEKTYITLNVQTNYKASRR